MLTFVPIPSVFTSQTGFSTAKKRLSANIQSYAAPTAKLSAVLFDCDGVLAESERDGHRLAFNTAFESVGLPDHWDSARYGTLLSVGGGKERLTAHWNEVGWPRVHDHDALVKQLHVTKTMLFGQLVADGRVPLRMGVAPLIASLINRGIAVAVCSTSQERAVRGVVAQLGDTLAAHVPVFAGDIVKRKKPAPDIYLLALEQLQLQPGSVCVVEDSAIGVAAAKAAGLPVLVTKSAYTQDEDFSQADRVVQSLVDDAITIADLETIVQLASTTAK